MSSMRNLTLGLIVAGGCIVYGSLPASAHVYVCLCTEIVDFCYWEDNH